MHYESQTFGKAFYSEPSLNVSLQKYLIYINKTEDISKSEVLSLDSNESGRFDVIGIHY